MSETLQEGQQDGCKKRSLFQIPNFAGRSKCCIGRFAGAEGATSSSGEPRRKFAQVCRHWRGGRCVQGSRCRFLHSLVEETTLPDDSAQDEVAQPISRGLNRHMEPMYIDIQALSFAMLPLPCSWRR
mmetsp:Transcript_32994/g.94787  ORF Transcript_32994/g.94787 Transcript_32994/m.94787 type:complete len:127 (-) Transcript_32994:112-492(-)